MSGARLLVEWQAIEGGRVEGTKEVVLLSASDGEGLSFTSAST